MRAMTCLVAVLALCAGAVAAPQKVERKPAPTALMKAARDAFTSALEADAAGDLKAALVYYQKANAIAPHPSTQFNVADLHRRLNQTEAAIAAFESYLELAPNAPDRATVLRYLDELSKQLGHLFLTTPPPSDAESVDLTNGYLLVDGAIVKQPGVEVRKPTHHNLFGWETDAVVGAHEADWVSAVSYAHQRCDAEDDLTRGTCMLKGPPRIDGNVVIAGVDDIMVLPSDTQPFSERREIAPLDVVNHRVQLRPGKHSFFVLDDDGRMECPRLVLDVPTTKNVVTYVFIGARESEGVGRCRKLDIKVHRLRFAP